MTLLIYALKSWKRETAVNVLNVVQLAAVIVITVIMVSSVMIRYQYYAPFSDVLQSDGILCNFSPTANYDTENRQDPFKYIAGDELKSYLPDAEKVISCNYGPSWFADENGEPLETNSAIIMYDDEMLGRYEPGLSNGRWLNKSSDAGCIEGVISENDLGIEVGDTIRIGCFSLEEEDSVQDILIVGKLRENAKIVGYWRGDLSKKDVNISSLYGTASFAAEQQTVLLLSSEYLSGNTTVLQGIFGPAMITFPKDYSQEKLEQARQQLADYNCRSSYLLSEINSNSMEYILEHINDLLPIIIVLLIMVAVSSISSSALSTRRGIKNCAVFYIVGLEWKRCILINLIQSAIILLCAVMISAASLVILTGAGTGLRIIINGGTVLSAAAISVFYMITSMIMPAVMLSGTTPKQIFTR